MSGWQYTPRIRIAYANGPDTIYLLTSLGGGGLGAHSIQLRYRREAVQRENPTRGIRKRDFGIRIEVLFTYDVTDMTQEATFVDIFNAACRDDASVYLALDGTTEMLMVVPEEGGYTMTPLARKNFIGMRIELTLITAEVLEAVRPILSASGATQWA